MNELTRKIDRILWGKSIVTVDGRFTDAHMFILRSLSIQEANYTHHIYEQVLEDSLLAGIMTNDELLELYEKHDIWTQREEARIRNFERNIGVLKAQIRDSEFFPMKQKQLQKKLDKFQRQLKVDQETKTTLFNCSAETRAAEISRRFMVSLSTENRDGSLYWKEESDFLAETDVELIYNIALAYYHNNMFPETEMREIARNGQWRFKWNASKNGIDLFGRPIAEWSEMQDALVYWSQFYDFVLDHPERPSTAVANDDAACDAWVDDKMKSRGFGGANKKSKSNLISPRKGRTTGMKQEIFTMVQAGDSETVERVQDMNTSLVRKKLQGEHKRISKSKGRVSEWQLRGKEYLSTLESNK